MKKFIASFLAVAFVVGCVPSVLASEIDAYASADWEEVISCVDKCSLNGQSLSYNISRNKELTYKTVDSSTGLDIVYVKDTASKALKIESLTSTKLVSLPMQFKAISSNRFVRDINYGNCTHPGLNRYGDTINNVAINPYHHSSHSMTDFSFVFFVENGIKSLNDLDGITKPGCTNGSTTYCESSLDIGRTLSTNGYLEIDITDHYYSWSDRYLVHTPQETFRVKVDNTKPKVLTVAFTDQYASVVATDSETGIKEYGISSVSSPNDIFWQTNQQFMINPKDSQFLFWAKDGVNNISEPFTLITDTTPPLAPTITHNGSDGYNASNVTVTIADGVDSESGVDKTEYSIDGSSYQTYTSPFTVSSSSTILAKTTDKAGNVSDVSTKQILIDKTAPNLTYTLSPSDFTYKNVDINFSFTDSGVGIDRVEADTGEIFTDENFTYVAQENGTYTFDAFDLLGNSKTTYIDITNIDRTPPDAYVDIDTDEIVPDKVVATVSSNDNESGIKSITLNGQTKNQNTADFDITENGTYTASVLNNAGLSTDVSFTVSNIDKVPPVGTYTLNPNDFTKEDVEIEVLSVDDLSGVQSITDPDGVLHFTDSIKFTVNTNRIYNFLLTDNMGNTSTLSVDISNIDKTPPDVTHSISSLDYTNQNVVATITATDTQSGVREIVSENGLLKLSDNTFEIEENGTYKFIIYDNVGNVTEYSFNITNIDKEFPTIDEISFSTTDYTNQNVLVSVKTSDNIEVDSISINGEVTNGNTATFSALQNGTYDITLRDISGNIVNDSFTLSNIDKTAPVIDSVKQSNGKLEVLASDNLSGVYKFSFDGGSTFTDDNFIEDPTPALYNIVVSDNAGNLSTPFDYRVQTIVIDSGNSNLDIDNLPDSDLIGRPDVEEIRMSLNVVEVEDDDEILDDSLVAQDILENETIEQALDISVIKTVVSTDGSLDETKLSDLSSPIKISIENTGNLKKPTVIRVHNGVAEKLDTEVFGKDIIFETDKFSTYFITEEIRSTGGSGGSNGSTEDKEIDDIISDLNDDLDFTVDTTEPNQKVEVDLGLDLDELKKQLDRFGIDIDWILNSIIPYTKVNGEIIIAKISVYEDNKVYFIAPVVGTYSFCVNFKDFSDLADSKQLTDVYYSTAREILKGTSDNTFEPQTSVTRGMMIEILYRLTGVKYKATTNYFTDVTPTDYYFNAVNWGYENGFIKGTGDNKFSPDKSVTREDMAVISANIFGLTSKSKPTFWDFDLISSYALESVAALSDNKIIVGFDNLFMPKDKTKRLDVSTVIHRLNRVLILEDDNA